MRRPFSYGILDFVGVGVLVMSPEILSILGVGVGLAVLMFGMIGWVRSDMAKIEERLRQEIRGGDEQLRQEIRGVDERLRLEIRGVDERLRQEIQQVRLDLRQDIQDGEQRFTSAVTNHRHPQPDGEPVFTQPA